MKLHHPRRNLPLRPNYFATSSLKLSAGLKKWDVVSWYYDGRVLGDVSCRLLSTFLDLKSSEATEIYILTVREAVF